MAVDQRADPFRSFLECETADRVQKGKRFTAIVPCGHYWKHNLKTIRRLGAKRGGEYVDGIHFRYEGGQVRRSCRCSATSDRARAATSTSGLGSHHQPAGLPPEPGQGLRRQLADTLSPTGARRDIMTDTQFDVVIAAY